MLAATNYVQDVAQSARIILAGLDSIYTTGAGEMQLLDNQQREPGYESTD